MTHDWRTRAILASLTTTILLTGCGGANTYPANLKTAYIDSCKSIGGTRAQCECALGHIEAHVSVGTFEAYKRAFDARKIVHPSWLSNAPRGCPHVVHHSNASVKSRQLRGSL
jgi:hypothetical protein